MLHIGQYGNFLKTFYWYVLSTSYFNILRTLVGDVPWCYIQDHVGLSIGCLLVMSAECLWDAISLSGEETGAGFDCFLLLSTHPMMKELSLKTAPVA